MENKNNNLENFIHNKLSETGDPNDSWDKPSADIWKNAQAQISPFKKRRKIALPLVLWLGSLGLVLLLCGYNWHLHQQVKELKDGLEIQKEKMEAANHKTALNGEKQLNEINLLKAENEKLLATKDLITQQKIDLENDLSQQRIKNAALIKHGKELANQVNGLENTVAKNNFYKEEKEERIIEKPEIINIQTLPSLLTKQLAIGLPEISTEIISQKINPVKKSHKVFEIGYEFALTNINIPSIQDYKDLSSTSKNSTDKVFNTRSNGIQIGYSTVRNLFIHTGIRMASFDMVQDFKTGLIYDESKEYTKPNGETGNSFDLNLTNPYIENRSSIGIEIPQGADLKDGDVLVLYLNESQSVKSYQVPFGVQYFWGKGKLNYFVEGGAQWNKMVFSDYQLISKVVAKNEELLVDKIEYFSKASFSKKFFSAYGGIGLDYELAKHWHARVGYVSHFNFIKNKSKEFSNSELKSNAFSLGLNYRF